MLINEEVAYVVIDQPESVESNKLYGYCSDDSDDTSADEGIGALLDGPGTRLYTIAIDDVDSITYRSPAMMMGDRFSRRVQESPSKQ